MYLSRTDALAQLQRAEADYTLPDGTQLRLRELMAAERIVATDAGDFDPETKRYQSPDAMYALVVRFGVIDGPGGEPLFTDDDLDLLMSNRRHGGAPKLSLSDVADAIWALSEATPDSFRQPRAAADQSGDADPDGSTPDRAGPVRANRRGSRDRHATPGPVDGSGE